MNYTIEKSTLEDLDEIFERYTDAATFQRNKETVVVWPNFDRTLVEKEILEGRQWKLIQNNTICCVWAVAFSDPQIWEERDKDPSVYIHRIATHPNARGQQMVKKIVDWAIPFAKRIKKTHLRLDTLGNNTRLIEYYQSAGFDFLGMFPMKNTAGLPDHYHTAPVCLFEIKL
ncbi:MAG: GNAT family N-acetyltransferase [Flavobacteriaceae bacterium]|nr:GNAT family N-acetyltransferase [Flavobacteriaceae bacterium]